MPSRFREEGREERKEGYWDYSDADMCDEEIRPFLRSLWRAGYPTFTSCAGHPEPKPGHMQSSHGFIWFNQNFTPEEEIEVRKIARRFGIDIVYLDRSTETEQQATISFSPLG